MNTVNDLLQNARNYAKAMARERRNLETKSTFDRKTRDEVIMSVVDTLEFLEALAKAFDSDPSSSEIINNLISASRERLQLAGVLIDGVQGEPFDTAKHSAVKEVVTEQASQNQILSVTSYGITCNGERIRPARVVVAVRGKE